MAAANLKMFELVDMEDPRAILEETKTIVLSSYPDFDFQHLDFAFITVNDLFNGNYPGYRGCNTLYHDFLHTAEVFLAMSRLLHGAVVEGTDLNEKQINMGLVSALMHDTGYIQTIDDNSGTGAKYTMSHIQRSVDFIGRLYGQDPYFCVDIKDFGDILFCTGVNTNIGAISFSSPPIALLGKMLGTADLLGQMSDRQYLERLSYLYREFVEGDVKGFESESDLLIKTINFHTITHQRFYGELGGVIRYSRPHFQKRWQIDSDLYTENIEKNIQYLKWLFRTHPSDYAEYLRRRDGLD